MIIKNNEINGLMQALVELAQLKTGFKIALATAKSIRNLENISKDLEKARISIVESYCLKEDGKPKIEGAEYVFENDELKKNCTDEIDLLLNSEIEVELHTLPAKYYEGIVDITPSLVYRLEKFIE